MSPQLEGQYLSARLAGARQLLADSPQDDDPIGFHQFSQLVSELETELFKLLESEGATMRNVEGERDFELKADAVQRARSRVENMTISDPEQEVSGYIVGWSDHRGTFDLQLYEGGEVMTGQVMPSELERLMQEGMTALHEHVRARVKVREISVRQRMPKKVYTLLSLELDKAPSNWPQTQQVRLA
jgi:hypothetical protein